MNFSKARVTKFNSTKRKDLFDDKSCATPGPGRYTKLEINTKKGLK